VARVSIVPARHTRSSLTTAAMPPTSRRIVWNVSGPVTGVVDDCDRGTADDNGELPKTSIRAVLITTFLVPVK